jgi:predicted nucleotidyltransferase
MASDPAAALEAKLEAGRQVACSLVEEGEVLGMYLAGSLTAGLGSSRSDVDLFVIVPNAEQAAARIPEQRLHEGTRVDIEVRTDAELRELTGLLGEFTATSSDLRQLFVSADRVDAAVRLVLGADIVPSALLDEVRRELPRTELRKTLIAQYCNQSLNLLEDLAGAVRDADDGTASLISYALVLRALQAYLAGCDDLYIGEKWTWRKLTRSGLDQRHVADMWGLLHGGDMARDALVPARIAMTQALLSAAQVDGWDEPHAGRWTAWGTARAGLCRAPEWLPIRLRDQTALVSVDYTEVHLSSDGVRLWGLADGRPRAAVVEDMAGHLAPSPTLDSINEYVDTLLERDVLMELPH